MKIIKCNKELLFLIVVLFVVTIPPLALTDFNTKGEPREAIVAISMLDSGNFILPTNNGIDIAYKPPFFHWSIAACATFLNRGEVNEFVSRLPSALSFILLTLFLYNFLVRTTGDKRRALLTALLMPCFFETHRAAGLCRVDMLLSCFVDIALLLMYDWIVTRKMKGIPLGIIAAMGLGCLVKGPVAIALPIISGGIFALMYYKAMDIKTFINCTLPFIPVVIGAILVSSAWYVLAYNKGGENFLNLVLEENVGRMTGKMTYESHSNPWYINLFYVLSGLLPIVLLVLLPLTKFRKRKWTTYQTRLRAKLGNMSAFGIFATVVIVSVFIFFCIPQSKRSVYLIPIYPFLAYAISSMMIWMSEHCRKMINFFTFGIIALAALACIVYVVLYLCHFFPIASIDRISIITDNITALTALFLALMAGVFVVFFKKKNHIPLLWHPLVSSLILFMTLDYCILPPILNSKSDRADAKEIMGLVPQGEIRSFCTENMMRFFNINYYSHNRVVPLDDTCPNQCWLLLADKDINAFHKRYPNHELERAYKSHKKACDVKDYYSLFYVK